MARILPVFIFSLIGDSFADTVDRKKILFITQTSMALVALPFLFENTLGRDQVETGLLLTPWPLAVAVVAVAGWMTKAIAPRCPGARVAEALVCAWKDGEVFATGTTSGSGVPTVQGSIQARPAGATDAFVAHLSADGSRLLAATCLGGSDRDAGAIRMARENAARAGVAEFIEFTVKAVVIGGSACPPAMIRSFQEDYGVEVLHAWGMTEMSPLGTVCTLKAKHKNADKVARYAVQSKQGRAIFGVDMKIVGADGKELPMDGKAFGDLHVRGPWVISSYFKGEGGDPLRNGWFPTGDVATIDPDGYMQITDRSKDVIKSGGEWISSIDLENIAVAHPAVAEAAVIGIKHPKWDERPVVLVVKKAGQEVSKEELLKFYEGKIAKWWMPDDVVFVKELPHTATGKLSKLTIREQFKDYKLPTA